MKQRGISRDDLLKQTGWTTSKLSRTMNGQTVLTLEDLMLLLRSCKLEFAELPWQVGDERQHELHDHRVVSEHLQRQLAAVQGEIARIERARPST